MIIAHLVSLLSRSRLDVGPPIALLDVRPLADPWRPLDAAPPSAPSAESAESARTVSRPPVAYPSDLAVLDDSSHSSWGTVPSTPGRIACST